MNEETATPPLPALPGPTTKKRQITFTVPHILKSISLDADGFYHREVREGGPRQVECESTQEYSETPVENEPTFVVRATNQINFAKSIINVINDEVELSNGFRLVPTSPTATEYLAKAGTRVQIGSVCTRDATLSEQQGKSIYRIGRQFIVLP